MNFLLNKIKIILLIIILSFFLINVQAKTDLNRYWSLDKDGPPNLKDAKKRLSNRGELKLLEGIWTENDRQIVLIIFDDHPKVWSMHYSKYIIKHDNQDLIGTKEATFHRTKHLDYFIIFQNYLRRTIFGKVFVTKDNEISIKLFSQNDKKILKEYKLEKVYPLTR